MTIPPQSDRPARNRYDVIIVGGAMIGSAVAWFLTDMPDFDGRILVVERDPSYEFSSTAHTNSCMRQQFGSAINVKISQFAAEYVRNFRTHVGDDQAPELPIHAFGYLYLADSDSFAETLRAAQKVQADCGAGTRHMTADQIAQAYPFYNLDDILCGNHNLTDEGYFDGGTLFDWWKRTARARGVEYIANEVTAMTRNAAGSRVESVTLASGEVIACGTIVNATGPRAARTAAMAGIVIPVEPRKRYTYIFSAERPLGCDLPLTVDPSGVHVRTDGAYYMAGCAPDDDVAVAPEDFIQDHSLWEQKVWPALAHRIPAFEAIRVINSWVGHYAYNTLDQNAILGPHSRVENFIFANGFSGHGFQQSPAVGRGIAELITHGAYRTLDLAPLGYRRIEEQQLLHEHAVI